MWLYAKRNYFKETVLPIQSDNRRLSHVQFITLRETVSLKGGTAEGRELFICYNRGSGDRTEGVGWNVSGFLPSENTK